MKTHPGHHYQDETGYYLSGVKPPENELAKFYLWDDGMAACRWCKHKGIGHCRWKPDWPVLSDLKLTIDDDELTIQVSCPGFVRRTEADDREHDAETMTKYWRPPCLGRYDHAQDNCRRCHFRVYCRKMQSDGQILIVSDAQEADL